MQRDDTYRPWAAVPAVRGDRPVDAGPGRLSTLAEVRAATELGERTPAVDLEGWAAGFVAGVDYASATMGNRIRDEIAETAALLDETDRVRGRVSRARRTAAEVATGETWAVPVRQAAGWPEVTEPGTGNLASVRDLWPCRCPRTPSRCRPDCTVDHKTAGPGHHWLGYDADGRWSDPHRAEPTPEQLAASARVLARWSP